jgi:hypothetical protein
VGGGDGGDVAVGGGKALAGGAGADGEVGVVTGGIGIEGEDAAGEQAQGAFERNGEAILAAALGRAPRPNISSATVTLER